jgi:hypothetical protein
MELLHELAEPYSFHGWHIETTWERFEGQYVSAAVVVADPGDDCAPARMLFSRPHDDVHAALREARAHAEQAVLEELRQTVR